MGVPTLGLGAAAFAGEVFGVGTGATFVSGCLILAAALVLLEDLPVEADTTMLLSADLVFSVLTVLAVGTIFFEGILETSVDQKI
jgi:hypothetical protein